MVMFVIFIVLSSMACMVTSNELSTPEWPTFVPRPEGCEEPWESMPFSVGTTKGCFLFNEFRLNWDHARKVCKRLGGDLVVLDTESKRRDILHFMDSKGYINDNSWSHGMWHVGASNSFGFWEWVNGHSVTGGWRMKGSYKKEVKPNDGYQGYDMCMFLYTGLYPVGSYDMLSDYKCKMERYFICEKAEETSNDN